jgi:hypothetical protein
LKNFLSFFYKRILLFFALTYGLCAQAQVVAPSITLTASNQIICPNQVFTLTVSDTQSSLTTYSLEYLGGPSIVSTNTGIVTFTINNLTVSTTLKVVATNSAGTDSETLLIDVILLANSGTITTTASSSYCYGQLIDKAFTGTAGSLDSNSSTATLEYLWRYSTDGGFNWTSITSNTTGLSLNVIQSLGGLVTNTIFERLTYAASSTTTCGPLTSNVLRFNVENPIAPSITYSDGNTICTSYDNNRDVYLTVSAPQPGYEYYWDVGGDIASNTSVYTVTHGSLVRGGYTVKVYGVSSGGCSTTITQEILTVTDPGVLSINTNEPSDTICAGDAFTVSVSDTLSTQTTYTITYPGGSEDKTTNTGQVTFTVPAGAILTESVISITADRGVGCSSTATRTIYVPYLAADAFNGAGTITTTASLTLCSGDFINAGITEDAAAALDADSSTSTLTYLWRYSVDNGTSWANIPGPVTTENITENQLRQLGGLTTPTLIERQVQAERGGVYCDPTSSNRILFSVAVDPIAPSITYSDGNTICTSYDNNRDVYLTVSAPQPGYEYYWDVGGDIASNTSVYTVTHGSLVRGGYTVKVYGVSSGGCSTTITQEILTVTDPGVLSINTNEPSDTICAGDAFTVSVSDTLSTQTTYTITYPGGSEDKTTNTGQVTFTVPAGAILTESVISITADRGVGCSSTATRTIYVPYLAADAFNGAGTITTTASLTLCSGDFINAGITEDAAAALDADSSTSTLTYLWRYSVDNGTSWANIPGPVTTENITENQLRQLGGLTTPTLIERQVQAERGGVYCDPTSSNRILFSVAVDPIAPSITYSDGNTICTSYDNNRDVYLTVSAPQPGYEYYWDVGGDIASNTSVYTVTHGSLVRGGYTVKVYGVSSGGCSTTITQEILTVTDPGVLSINTNEPSDTICAGDAFTVSVSDTLSTQATYTITYPGGSEDKTTNTGQVTFTVPAGAILTESVISITADRGVGCSSTATRTIYVPYLAADAFNGAGTITTTASLTLCSGDFINAGITEDAAAALDADSSTSTLTYLWRYSVDNGTSWANIPGPVTTENITENQLRQLGGLTTPTLIERQVQAERGGVYCDPTSSNRILFSVAVDPIAPSITYSDGNTICTSYDNNRDVYLTVSAPQPGYEYYWDVGGDIASNTSVYTVTHGSLVRGGYTVKVYGVSSGGCSTTITQEILTVTDPGVLSINTNEPSDTICAGDAFTVSVSDTLSTQATYTITYPGGSEDKTTNTGQVTFTVPAGAILTESVISITADRGVGCSSTATRTIYVPYLAADAFNGAGTITTTASLTLCSGDFINAGITEDAAAALDADSSTSTLTYLWRYSVDNGTSWANIPGPVTTENITENQLRQLGGLTTPTLIERQVQAERGGVYCDPTSSNRILFSVAVDPIAPSITYSDGNTICTSYDNNRDVYLTVSAPQPGYEYYWDVGGDIASNTSVYTVTHGSLVRGGYTVKVYGVSSGGCSTTITQEILTVTDPGVLSINTNEPSDTICAGDAFTVSVSDTLSTQATYTITYPGGSEDKTTNTGQVTFTVPAGAILTESVISITADRGVGCSSTATRTIYVPYLAADAFNGAGTITTTASLTLCSGDFINAGITEDAAAALDADSSTSTLTYLWRYSVDNGTSWANIPGPVTTENITENQLRQLGGLTTPTLIERQVQAERGGVYCDPTSSNRILFSVAVDPIAPSITYSDGNTICTSYDNNRDVYLTVSAPQPGYEYYWDVGGDIASNTSVYTVTHGSLVRGGYTVKVYGVSSGGCSTTITQEIFNSYRSWCSKY